MFLGDATIESSATASFPRLESRLADLFGYAHGVLFGRARSGIVALMDSLGAAGTIVVPSNVCPVLHVAARAQGWTTRLCPIDPETGLAEDAAMADIVAAGEGPGIAMPSNLYGFVAAYPATLAAARRRGWFVLENDTMATKARLRGGEAKTAFGDALLVSFGDGKTLAAGGGGAIMTDDASLAGDLRRSAAGFAPIDALGQAREDWMLALRLHLKKGFPGGPPMAGLSEHLFAAESQCLRYAFTADLGEALSAALDALDDTVRTRRRQAGLWARKLAPLNGALRLVDAEQPAPWRFVRRVPGRRDAAAQALRAGGIDAGVNYPPLSDSFPRTLRGPVPPAATRWGGEVLNLWLTPDYDSARMDRAAAILERTLAPAAAEPRP